MLSELSAFHFTKMHFLVKPDSWVVLQLPSDNLKVIQVTPNT
jgi:hypothetical protein